MEKVKLTQEQANAIENHRNAFETLVRKHRGENIPFPTKGLSVNEVIRAYFDGYEVEPEFKVGDWVVRTSENGKNHELGRVLKISAINPNYVFERIDIAHSIKEVRHATPEEIAQEKERRWWKSHNRDVWEIKCKDTLINVQNRKDLFVISRVGKGTIIGYSFITEEYEHLSISDAKTNFEVFCFAEDRKDV